MIKLFKLQFSNKSFPSHFSFSINKSGNSAFDWTIIFQAILLIQA